MRRWHPNQDWIWRAGGFGVFDPGINALSIVTHILPPMFITSATLDFPENRDAPVAAHLTFRTSGGMPVTMELDWLQTGPQSWDILAETEAGSMVLSGGGSKLVVDGRVVHDEPEAEYPMLYRRFAEIVARRRFRRRHRTAAPRRRCLHARPAGMWWRRSST